MPESFEVQPSGCVGSLCELHGWKGVSFWDRERAWVVGTYGAVIHTSDGGNAWELQNTTLPTSLVLRAVQTTSFFDVFVVGDEACVLRSTDGGGAWEVMKAADSTQTAVTLVGLLALHFISKELGWIVGRSRQGQRWGMLRTEDGGLTWAAQEYQTETPGASVLNQHNLNAVHFLNASHGYAVGDRGVLLATKDGGGAWALEESCSDDDLFALVAGLPEPGSFGFLVGRRGLICESVDGCDYLSYLHSAFLWHASIILPCLWRVCGSGTLVRSPGPLSMTGCSGQGLRLKSRGGAGAVAGVLHDVVSTQGAELAGELHDIVSGAVAKSSCGKCIIDA
ncbi:hypothetical protein CYMTET_4275 [Cymbomonas tetramitiformis]|uniref:Photosynthesis system II assembly factor Ycf48/Hcf136-like domain-containing protein n=1 Tax=Cymbomonas tetramitiformis TaxID=36881 RepID=A0AAE0H1P4_9CHLO|nr:hypothetical protein CYMTET_4275 [Cymbomonas tetramitiformis]